MKGIFVLALDKPSWGMSIASLSSPLVFGGALDDVEAGRVIGRDDAMRALHAVLSAYRVQ